MLQLESLHEQRRANKIALSAAVFAVFVGVSSFAATYWQLELERARFAIETRPLLLTSLNDEGTALTIKNGGHSTVYEIRLQYRPTGPDGQPATLSHSGEAAPLGFNQEATIPLKPDFADGSLVRIHVLYALEKETPEYWVPLYDTGELLFKIVGGRYSKF